MNQDQTRRGEAPKIQRILVWWGGGVPVRGLAEKAKKEWSVKLAVIGGPRGADLRRKEFWGGRQRRVSEYEQKQQGAKLRVWSK